MGLEDKTTLRSTKSIFDDGPSHVKVKWERLEVEVTKLMIKEW